MRQYRVARRYAEALITAAEQQNLLEKVSGDCEMLQRLLMESRDLQVFLKSPVIKREKKQEALRAMFAKKLDKVTMSFLELITEKGREEFLSDILQQYFALRDDRLGIVNVEIKAATELSKNQHEGIRKKFEGLTRKSVRLSFSLDKHLKGGFVARVGDTMYDGSVKRQLELLRERFAEGVGSN
ncbi:MAG: ATP synthase F1 subunit delta [Bacteroidota bacterium]